MRIPFIGDVVGKAGVDAVKEYLPKSIAEWKLELALGGASDAIVVDFHCEATSEKQAAGHFCDGRVSLVAGTHTHTPSADHRILPRGTAYITDAGMTGDYDSIVGIAKAEMLRRFTTGISTKRLEPALGAPTMSGIAVETDDATGLAVKVAPVRLGGVLEPAVPAFWTASQGE